MRQEPDATHASAGPDLDDIAHQLRTPLASIQTAAHVLNRRALDLAAGRAPADEVLPVLSECLTVIEQGVDRIDRYSKHLHRRLARER